MCAPSRVAPGIVDHDALIFTSLRFAPAAFLLFISLEREQSYSNEAHEMDALPPDLMLAAKRLDEVSEILAAGLMRLTLRQSSQLSADSQESSVDCAADQSVHPNVLNGGLE